MTISDEHEGAYPALEMHDYKADKEKADAYNYYAMGGSTKSRDDLSPTPEPERIRVPPKRSAPGGSPQVDSDDADAISAAKAMAAEFNM
jgi:hypothetical protein